MDSFVFYKSFAEALHKLPADEYKEAMEAILAYAFDGIETEFEHTTSDIIFTLVKPQIDANRKRRVDGMKGGRPKKTNGYESEKPMVIENAKTEKPNVNVNVNVNEEKKESIKKKQAFSAPSVEEVKAYILEQGYKVDADRFVDFYASKNWMVGKNKMKDWKAAVRNWARQDVSGYRSDTNSKIHNYNERKYDFDELRSML